MIKLMMGDCLDVMRGMDADSVDAVVTDPPAGINFMNRAFDSDRGGREQWIAWLTVRLAECYRVAKPGARMLCWALPRTSHWTGTAVEDAGWQIEDRVSHLFGTGFPKHASKLKPAAEDWWLAIKPAGRAVELNIDDCRIATTDSLGGGDQSAGVKVKVDGWDRPWMHDEAAKAAHAARVNANVAKAESLGRWPANVALTCCGSDPHDDDCAVAMLDRQSGTYSSRPGATNHEIGHTYTYGWEKGGIYKKGAVHHDSGGASRFFATFKSEDDPIRTALCGLLWGSQVDIIDDHLNGDCRCEIANNAGPLSSHSPRHVNGTALSIADTPLSEPSGQNASSAESPFGSCGTSTVPSLARAGIRNASDLRAVFTTATESELRLLSETLTETTRSIGSVSSPGSRPTKLILTIDRANVAATRQPTGITTITISHWRSDGSADPVTFRVTPNNSEPGAAGSASRFIYTAKASRSDRGAGNNHPTVKSFSLMSWLCRLITPPGGTILDPFAGSGSTGKAAIAEGFGFVGIESDPAYFAIAESRIDAARAATPLLATAATP